MLRRCLLAGVALVALIALLPQVAAAESTAKTALLNGPSTTTVDGFEKEGVPISLEQAAAEKAGYTVTVASGPEWEAMTAEQFAKYQVLIIGDPHCSVTPASVVNSAAVWTPVVMGKGPNAGVGNRVLVGTDPEWHFPSHNGAEHLVQDGISFAGANAGATGVYFDTSCEDPGVEEKEEEIEGTKVTVTIPGEDVTKVLDFLTETGPGHWGENANPPCGGSVQQVASNPFFSEGETKLLDSDIQGWGCSDHITFPQFPADWFPIAVATDTSTLPTCGTDPETKEEVCGQAYVLLAGSGVKAEAPNLSLEPPTGSTEAGPTHTHTVTANVHAGGKPIAGVPVSFSVTGQNAGVSGTCSTPECKSDENGNVSFTYADANGVGNDVIIAAATIEHEVTAHEVEELDVRPAVVVKSEERATATQQWTPVVITPAPPAPVVTVLPAKTTVVPTGTAHLASTSRACVAASGYLASVSGKGIASVTYTLDGHKLKTLTHASHGAFALRIHVSSGRAHHLSIHVTFTAASHTSAKTLHKTLARCAARVIKPRFTG